MPKTLPIQPHPTTIHFYHRLLAYIKPKSDDQRTILQLYVNRAPSKYRLKPPLFLLSSHSHVCPLSGPSHPNDWCHHFAKAPAEVFHSAKWAELSKELRIDLRSLPFTALYAIKKAFNLKPLPKEAIRLGRPRVGKHEITVDHCTLNGTYENTKISKRENPELFKKLKKE